MSKKELANVADDAVLAALAASAPQEAGFARLQLPRLTFKSQDVMEGKGKSKKVVVEAGTFFTEVATDEKDENGKPVWDKTEQGLEIEGFIVYTRKQLRFYDEPSDTFYSTPIFDDADQMLPLFAGGKKVATGTPAELKKSFEYTTEDGKTRSKLEDNVVMYILFNDELHQMTLRGSSMYSFKDFARKVPTAYNVHLIHFSSEAQEKGSIEWNQMKFTALRLVTADEAAVIGNAIAEIKEAVELEREYYNQQSQDATVEAAVVAALPEGEGDDF